MILVRRWCQTIKYRVPASPEGGTRTARVAPAIPEAAVTPGQACVFYAGNRVLGGGWIARGEGTSPVALNLRRQAAAAGAVSAATAV